MLKQESAFHNSVMDRAARNYPARMTVVLTVRRLLRFVVIFGDRGKTVKAFVYSLVATAVISVLAAVILGGLDFSSADVFQLKDVRL